MKKLLCIVMTLLLLCTALPGLAAPEAAKPAPDAPRTEPVQESAAAPAQDGSLTVTGSAAITAAPDRASISVGVNETAAEVSQAQTAANAKVNAIVEAVKALGVEESKISTSNYSIFPQTEYDADTGRSVLVGYQVSNTVTINLEDFSLLDRVIDEAVAAGANEMYGITFDVSTRSELYRQALEQAVQAAADKAQLMAAAAGMEIASIEEIREVGGISVSSGRGAYMNATDAVAMAEEAGATAIQGGELSVSAQVELVYRVQAR